MVSVGELECFVKEVGGHGPEWANTVLETYPDLDNEVYDEVKKFVKQILLGVRKFISHITRVKFGKAKFITILLHI